MRLPTSLIRLGLSIIAHLGLVGLLVFFTVRALGWGNPVAALVTGLLAFLALLSLLSEAFRLRSEIRGGIADRRRRRGCCTRCGYDLRASATRCPECGTAFRASSAKNIEA